MFSDPFTTPSANGSTYTWNRIAVSPDFNEYHRARSGTENGLAWTGSVTVRVISTRLKGGKTRIGFTFRNFARWDVSNETKHDHAGSATFIVDGTNTDDYLELAFLMDYVRSFLDYMSPYSGTAYQTTNLERLVAGEK